MQCTTLHSVGTNTCKEKKEVSRPGSRTLARTQIIHRGTCKARCSTKYGTKNRRPVAIRYREWTLLPGMFRAGKVQQRAALRAPGCWSPGGTGASTAGGMNPMTEIRGQGRCKVGYGGKVVEENWRLAFGCETESLHG